MDYWIGPYDIRIPNSVNAVFASDGGNILQKNGMQTEMYVDDPLTEQEYKEKYAVLKDDGNYYYKQEDECDDPNYWVGPYGVRVHITVNAVKAGDGGNILYKDGMQTEMHVVNPLTKEEYREKYAELSDDGYYYYKQ